MLAPEGGKAIAAQLGYLQRILLEAHQDPALAPREGEDSWELALLMNCHRFPLDDQGKVDTKLGLTMSYNTPFLDPILFPFITEVRICDLPMEAQFQACHPLPLPVWVWQGAQWGCQLCTSTLGPTKLLNA